jgi:RNA polymerase sigma-70 factor (ECF subfamily)
MFGSRILRLAKYITWSDADAEDVLVETFLKACADGSGSRADEGMRVRLATIAVREALAKRSYRGHAEAEDTLREEVVIREIFVWGDNHHSPEQTGEILEQAMRSLDPICRAVFVLRDIEGISVEQTALALNRTVPALEAATTQSRSAPVRATPHGRSGPLGGKNASASGTSHLTPRPQRSSVC